MQMCDTTKQLSQRQVVTAVCQCGTKHHVVGYVTELLNRSPYVPCLCGQQTDMTAEFTAYREYVERLKTFAETN